MDEPLDSYVVLLFLRDLMLMKFSHNNVPSTYGCLNPVLPYQDLVFLEGCSKHC